MRARIWLILLAALSLVSVVCNQPFEPRPPLQDQLVVFSILSTDRDAQFVRVERNYMPPDFSPQTYTSDNSLANAVVSLKDGNSTYDLHDTIFARPDTSRFKFPLRAYVLSPFVPQYGKSYEITVLSPELGRAVGKAIVPGKPMLAMGLSARDVLASPGSYKDDEGIPFEALLSDVTKGYIGRLFIDYSVLKGNGWVDGRIEVPIAYKYFDIHDFKYVINAQLTRRPTTHQMNVAYTNQMYNAALIEVAYSRFPASKLVFSRIVYQFLQAEQNLYDYYQVAHAFNDPYSTRLDEPIYSNIDGGVGVVGAYTLDSLVFPLPQHFVYNRQ